MCRGKDYDVFYNVCVEHGATVDLPNIPEEERGTMRRPAKLVIG
jgi:hypothetical protein